MELQRITPEGFVAEGVVPENPLAIYEQSRGIVQDGRERAPVDLMACPCRDLAGDGQTEPEGGNNQESRVAKHRRSFLLIGVPTDGNVTPARMRHVLHASHSDEGSFV
jgi:hypothetical protein